MITNIIDPITKQSYKLLSKSGKRLLKYYVQAYQKGGNLSLKERYALVKTQYSLPCKDTINTLTSLAFNNIKKTIWKEKLNIEFPNYKEMLKHIDSDEIREFSSSMWKDVEEPGTFNETNKEHFQNYYRLCMYITHLMNNYIKERNKHDYKFNNLRPDKKKELQEDWRLQERKKFFKRKFIIEGDLTSNKEFMLQLILKDPFTFIHASNTLKGDKEVVLVAVEQDGLLLEKASPELKNDDDVVYIAVKQNGMALEFASDRLKSDIDIAKTAVKQDINALRDIDKSIKQDEGLRQIAFEKNDFLAKLFLKMPDNEIEKRINIKKNRKI